MSSRNVPWFGAAALSLFLPLVLVGCDADADGHNVVLSDQECEERCPASAPGNGSRCDDDITCGYLVSANGESCGGTSFTCVDGKWSIGYTDIACMLSVAQVTKIDRCNAPE